MCSSLFFFIYFLLFCRLVLSYPLIHSLEVEAVVRKYGRPVYLTSAKVKVGTDLLPSLIENIMQEYGEAENGVPSLIGNGILGRYKHPCRIDVADLQ
jgi:hypothetical protein